MDNKPFKTLGDPCKDRALSFEECAPLAMGPIDDANLFKKNLVDWKLLQQFITCQGELSKSQVIQILNKVSKILKTEPNLIKVNEPVCVIGDIHGQYYDLLKILQKVGEPGKPFHYLFLGDYVDRGIYGIECCLLLFALKISLPSKITLLRGNHESRSMTGQFTFRTEVIDAYDIETYESWMEVFDQLPISALVQDKYLALHGGISPELTQTDQINNIDRFREIPTEGLFCDLVWSDPMEDDQAQDGTFTENDQRETACFFGRLPLDKYLQENKLTSVLRGHQVQQEGYKMHKWKGEDEFPSVITVFSAPNYCGIYNNRGAVLMLEAGNIKISQFSGVEAPHKLPGGLNLIQWSMPILLEKVTDMLLCLTSQLYKFELKRIEDYTELAEDLQNQSVAQQEKIKRKLQLLNKVKAIAKFAQLLKTQKEEAEKILVYLKIAPDGKIDRQTFLEKKSVIKFRSKDFQLSQKLDQNNEKKQKHKAKN